MTIGQAAMILRDARGRIVTGSLVVGIGIAIANRSLWRGVLGGIFGAFVYAAASLLIGGIQRARWLKG